MASCDLCGKTIGIMGGKHTVLKNDPRIVCDNCFEKLRDDIDHAFSVCKTEAEIKQKRESLSQKAMNLGEEEKSQLLRAYIDETASFFMKNLKGETEQEEEFELNRIPQEKIDSHMLTTGFDFSGYIIKEYKGLVSGECVIGTGILSDFLSGFSDLTGTKSKAYSEKMKEVKKEALNEMIVESVNRGGNAIIGISYSHVTFAGSNMIGISVNGTSVCLEKVDE